MSMMFREFDFANEFFEISNDPASLPSEFLITLRENKFQNDSPPIYLLPFYISALRFYAEDTGDIRGFFVNDYTDAINEIVFSIGFFGRSADMYIGEICDCVTTLMAANLVYVFGLFETLGKIGSSESIPLIERAVQKYASDGLCQAGIYALGNIGDRSSLDFIVSVMKEKFHPEIKIACVDAIEKTTKSPRSFISFVSDMGDLDDLSSAIVVEKIESLWPEIQGEDRVLKSKISEFLKNSYYRADSDRVKESIDECFVSINGFSILE